MLSVNHIFVKNFLYFVLEVFFFISGSHKSQDNWAVVLTQITCDIALNWHLKKEITK